jgi:hypothetical protein
MEAAKYMTEINLKEKYGFFFNLNQEEAIKFAAVRECGYSIPDIVKMGIEVALAQTRKTDGKHLDEREE